MSKIQQYGGGSSSGGSSPPPTAPFPFARVDLTYAAGTINLDASLSDLYHLILTGSGATIGKPTNLASNTRFLLTFTQDATGSRTLVGWNAIFDFGTAGIPILTSDAHATDYYACIYWPANGKYSGSAETIDVIAQGPGY